VTVGEHDGRAAYECGKGAAGLGSGAHSWSGDT
jgi:hypothetical protein